QILHSKAHSVEADLFEKRQFLSFVAIHGARIDLDRNLRIRIKREAVLQRFHEELELFLTERCGGSPSQVKLRHKPFSLQRKSGQIDFSNQMVEIAPLFFWIAV